MDIEKAYSIFRRELYRKAGVTREDLFREPTEFQLFHRAVKLGLIDVPRIEAQYCTKATARHYLAHYASNLQYGPDTYKAYVRRITSVEYDVVRASDEEMQFFTTDNRKDAEELCEIINATEKAKLLKYRSPRQARQFLIHFKDGHEEFVLNLAKYARHNGYTERSLRAVLAKDLPSYREISSIKRIK